MNKIAFFFALLLSHSIAAEFHAGMGFGWNTIDETFDSELITDEDKSGRDRYETNMIRFAPMIQLSYRFSLCNDWKIGLLAQWKYLNYRTPNVNSSRGQILPNSTFSSINIFGPDVMRDFTSKTHVENEGMLLGYVGKHFINGYVYIGLGPVLFNASNSIYLTSVHTPNGVGDHLISTSVTSHQTMWGGAGQLGYQYHFNQNLFINISYTYLQTGKYQFNNTINTAIFNGAVQPGSNTLFLKRAIEFTVQEFMLSLNLAF